MPPSSGQAVPLGTSVRSRVRSAIVERFSRMEPLIWNDRTAFVLRTLLAAGLALYAALFLQLASPGSAAVTVLIVANTARGGVISKGFWRILGTITGAIMTIVLFAWFAQAPILFLVMLSLWLGLCVFMAGMFRHFRSYAAVLAGYTVAIVTPGALTDPANVLQTALARVAVVTLGVICAGVVSMVLQPDETFDSVMADFRSILGKVAAGYREGLSDEPSTAGEAPALASLSKLDSGIEFAGMEVPEVSRRSGTLRRGVAALHWAVLAIPVVKASLHSLGTFARSPGGQPPPELGEWIAAVDAALRSVEDACTSERVSLSEAALEIARAGSSGDAILRIMASRDDLADVVRIQRGLEILHAAIVRFSRRTDSAHPPRPTQPIATFRDHRDAARNAVRAMLATCLAGLFCYYTAWTQAGTCIGIVTSLCALMATAPNTSVASVEFTKGAILSSIAAYFCKFVVVAHVSGFALLYAVLIPFLAAGIYGLTIPRLNSLSFGFVVLFLTQLGIANVMTFDAASFLNGAEAYAFTGVIVVLAFRVLLPVDPAAEVRRFAGGIRANVGDYLRRGAAERRQWDWLGWTVGLNQRLNVVMMRLAQAAPERTPELVADSGALALSMFEVLKIRGLIRDGALTGVDADMCERIFSGLSAASAEAELTGAVDALLTSPAQDEALEPARLIAASGLESIRLLLPKAHRLLLLSEG